MDAVGQGPRVLLIDTCGLAYHAAERRLDVRTRTAEPVVEVKVPESGVHVVPEQQADDVASEENALGIAGRPADLAGGLGKLVGLALSFWIHRLAGRRLVACFVGRLDVALSHGGKCNKQPRRREHSSETRTQRGGHGAFFLV